MYAYNVRWNLERDLVDELAVAEVYPAGTVHAMELESMYIRSLAGSFSSRLLELRAIGGTLIQYKTYSVVGSNTNRLIDEKFASVMGEYVFLK